MVNVLLKSRLSRLDYDISGKISVPFYLWWIATHFDNTFCYDKEYKSIISRSNGPASFGFNLLNGYKKDVYTTNPPLVDRDTFVQFVEDNKLALDNFIGMNARRLTSKFDRSNIIKYIRTLYNIELPIETTSNW